MLVERATGWVLRATGGRLDGGLCARSLQYQAQLDHPAAAQGDDVRPGTREGRAWLADGANGREDVLLLPAQPVAAGQLPEHERLAAPVQAQGAGLGGLQPRSARRHCGSAQPATPRVPRLSLAAPCRSRRSPSPISSRIGRQTLINFGCCTSDLNPPFVDATELFISCGSTSEFELSRCGCA